MKFFIDSANLREIAEAAALGFIEGVTTNPSLIAKEKQDIKKVIGEIAAIVPGPVSAEVISTTAADMVPEARELAKIAANIVVKVPLNAEGLKTVRTLAGEGIQTKTGKAPTAKENREAAGTRTTVPGSFFIPNVPRPFRKPQMQGAPEADTGSVHERTLRMAADDGPGGA